ncbi:hypothetical protein, conserved [Leishmania donovani]|uniref:Uncharacterized protein n=1 Tax=Leishmania donovani TaxID=5661 RepID=A0A3S7X563_LEIDO|nr:hypothetical protein, conserved [Leishmania donovani]AYU81582.1 hypothetical protein LdCL_320009100 [Leishmania donovani]TPP43555.1 hypothetical protein CGC21_19770 [Leishmania donovani]CBZ36775.1 hypothetical protein, conserved [Leishmania donovani]
MESLSRLAYGPSPPPTDAKGQSRGRNTGKKQRFSPPSSAHADAAHAATAPHRKREAKRLVEEYWQSVWHSHHEPPLYHTYSDRYGGSKGIPYASRKAAQGGSAASSGAAAYSASVPDCLTKADAAFSNGQLAEAKAKLQHALTVLQNAAEPRGLLTVAALTQFRSDCAEDAQRSFWLAEVLRRMGTLELIHGHCAEARELFNGSIAAGPLNLDSYLLRASCCEALRCFAEAYEDYSKYMKMTEPSMDVLAHSGKCAAEAGLSKMAREQLGRLLELSEEVLASTAATQQQVVDAASTLSTHRVLSSLPPLTSAAWAAGSLTQNTGAGAPSSLELLRSSCAFYVTHAYFYLGYVAEAEAASTTSVTPAEASALRRKASSYYSVAVRNADYVHSYEDSVRRSMAAGDYALARYLLRYLQRMKPDRAGYFLDAARACRAEGDIQGELRALSAALDRQQTITERRSTLFARGAVYADQLHDWSRAIRDFTLLIAIPSVRQPVAEADGVAAVVDWFTPLALVRRAAAYRSRQKESSRSSLLQHEDEEAALSDYAAFLDALAEMTAETGCETTDVPELCQPPHVVAALLVLANGAYHRHQYSNAVHYFCRAIALGWHPESSMPALLSATERLADQLYTSMAHHVMTVYPPGDDMFRVPYEARQATTLSITSSIMTSAEARRAMKSNERGNAGGNRVPSAESERSGFACPPLLYLMVDQRYQQLRALEPTFFAAIEDEFLDAWEPYRAEVERLKDEALSTRAGRRGKR